MNIQKHSGALLCFLLWAQPTVLWGQTTGVGINTENIHGVFHVDAAGNNPSDGSSIPAFQQADDIVVTDTGYVGIGTVKPFARLHIHTRGQAGVFPLRIADGSQGADKALTSDDSGLASWQAPPQPLSSAVYSLNVAPRDTFPAGEETPVANSEFSVPEDGFYSVDLRFWGEGINVNASNTNYRTVTRLQLRKNGIVVDEFQYNEPAYLRVTVFVTLYAEASLGDELSVWIYPELLEFPAGHLISNAVAAAYYDWIQTKILYKKLGVTENTHYFN